MNKLIILSTVIIFFSVNCTKKNILNRIEDGDFEDVVRGTYHGEVKFLRGGGQYADLISAFRAEIEAEEKNLPLITKRFFFVPEALNFIYKFAGYDQGKNYLILRYFARVLGDPVFAGYQIQFVYEVATKKLVKIYTAEVPLE